MSNGERGTSPWVWLAVGCLGAVVLGVVAVAALGYFGMRKAREFEAEMKDPAAREAKVLGILGASEMPEGYHAMVGLSVPFLMRVAVLSDRELEPGQREGGGFDQRGFIYIEMLQRDSGRDELRDYFEGRTDDASVLREHDIHIDAREVIRRGTLEQAGGTVLWVASRGRVRMSRSQSEGLTTLLLVDCPKADHRGRLGIWFGPDPSPGTPAEELDLAGTPADPGTIESFLSAFSLCPA